MGITPVDLAALCARTFPERLHQRIEGERLLPSRQHEMVAFDLKWETPVGEVSEPLIMRRYVSTLSWWRPDDLGKAQREATILKWLHEEGFPVPAVYAREFGPAGDVVLFSRLPGQDWSEEGRPFPEVVRPHVERLAHLLAWLHSLQPPDEVRMVAPFVTLPAALANLTALAAQLGSSELRTAVEQAMSRMYDVGETQPVLLHGDCHFSNVLLHEGRISGLVDWEYSALGDPRWDIANAYMQLVDFDAAEAADVFLATYLRYSGREFEGPPLYYAVASLQQWALSEWLVDQGRAGKLSQLALARDLIALRDVHRRRAMMALQWLE